MTAQRIKSRVFALFAVMVAFVSCAVTAPPALAANTPAAGRTTTFDKYLVMDANANVPPVTFTFSISAGEAADAVNDSPAIYEGIMTGTPTPSVSNAVFTAEDGTDDGRPADPAAAGSKYATKEVTVDLSGVTFSAPGIYRYVITENPSSAPGIGNDTESTRILDVYVEYDETATDTLKVAHYVLHEGTDNPNTADKSAGFTNTYATNDLTLAKTVTGNQGDRDKYFKFTVEIANAVAGTEYTVDLTDADASPTVDGNVETNPTSLTVAGDSKVTATFYLKHDQSIIIYGLTLDTNYTITEEDYSTDGYSTTHAVDSAVAVTGTDTGPQTMDADHTVAFTNDKSGVVPTGILLETTPYLVMGGVVIVGLVALVATRRRRAR